MFGRHPRLAIDAYLGISLPEESAIVSQDHYATKLKKRLQFAYKVASKEAQKAADRNKENYDLKVREATLDAGDRVLIRQIAFKGRHKISDKWDKDPYVVIDTPIAGIPVFKVQKESAQLLRRAIGICCYHFQQFQEPIRLKVFCLLNQLNKDLNRGRLCLSQLFRFLNLNIVLIQNRRK